MTSSTPDETQGGSIYNCGVATRPAANGEWEVISVGHSWGTFPDRPEAELFAQDVRYGRAFRSRLCPTGGDPIPVSPVDGLPGEPTGECRG